MFSWCEGQYIRKGLGLLDKHKSYISPILSLLRNLPKRKQKGIPSTDTTFPEIYL
jgi:hypothetical protein